MASPINFPYSPPTPPSHPIPPPHPTTPPPPPHVFPPPPPPGSHTTIIVIVCVSFGCLLFLAFLVALLCCFLKKKKNKTVEETEIIRKDEHLKVNEVILPGPYGTQSKVITIDDDVHIDEVISKNEKFGEGVDTKSKDNIVSAMEEGASTSNSSHHHLDHKP